MESVNKHFQSTASPVKFISIILIIFIAAFICGCKDDNSTPQGPTPTNPVQTSMGMVNLDFGNNVSSLFQSKDGGFIFCGTMTPSSEGGSDISITKLSNAYQVQWTKVFGSGVNDESNDAAEFDDGSIVTAGYTQNGSSGNMSICIMRVSQEGSLIWAKSIITGESSAGCKVCKTQDGNILVAAELNYTHFSLLKIDLSGNIIWSKRLYYYTPITKLQSLPAGGFVMLVHSGIMKLSSEGHVSWFKYFMNGSDPIGCNDIYQTSSGDFLIAGASSLYGYSSSMILKVTSEGEIIWAHTYGPSLNLNSINSCPDGSYIAAGNINIYYTVCGFYFKFSEDGLVNWSRRLDTTGLTLPRVFPVWDGGMVIMDNVSSYSNNGISVVKCKSDGETCDHSSSVETSVNNINLTYNLIQVQDSLVTLNPSSLVFNTSVIYTNYTENCKW